MRLPSGQPSWQNGMPQSMHRVSWSRISSSPAGGYTSRQSWMRTGTGRRLGSCRSYRRKPFGSGTLNSHDRLVDVATGGFGGPDQFHHPLVVARDHGGELADRRRPVLEQPTGDRRLGLLAVLEDELVQDFLLVAGERGE